MKIRSDAIPNSQYRLPDSDTKGFNSNSLEEIGITFKKNIKQKRKDQQNKSSFVEKTYSILTHDFYHEEDLSNRKNTLSKKFDELGKPSKKSLSSYCSEMINCISNNSDLDNILIDLDIDITMLYVVASYGSLMNHGEDKIKFEEVLKTILDSHEQQVTSGINTSKAFSQFSQDPDIRKKVRNLYYESLILNSSLHSMFDDLLASFGASAFELGLKSTQRALSDDLKSNIPSTNRELIGTLLTNIDQASKLSGIVKNVSDFVDELNIRKVVVTTSTVNICRDLIKLTIKQVYSTDLKRVVKKTIGEDQRDISLFLSGYGKLIKDLPLSLWKGEKIRIETTKLINSFAELIYSKDETITNIIQTVKSNK